MAHLSVKACRALALLHLSQLTSSFCVLPGLPGTRPAAGSRRPTASAFESVFIESPFVWRPPRDLASSRATHVASSSSMSTSSEVRASPRWEGFWSGGLDKGDMWDTGVVSPALQKLLGEGALPKGRSLVPGCGRGYDAIAFGKNGYDSTGLDLSPTGIEHAKALLAEETEELSGKVEFRSRDFFKFSAEEEGKFDVILDYTFLCALDPSARNDWADHMVSLLSPEGELVTLIFPIVKKDGGPPFAMSESLVSDLLTPRGLEAVHIEKLPPHLCHKGREEKTALGRWRFSKA